MIPPTEINQFDPTKCGYSYVVLQGLCCTQLLTESVTHTKIRVACLKGLDRINTAKLVPARFCPSDPEPLPKQE